MIEYASVGDGQFWFAYTATISQTNLIGPVQDNTRGKRKNLQ